MVLELAVTIKGSRPYNEDIIGHHGNYFWLMDGATDLFNLDLFPNGSNPYHIVNRLNSIIPYQLDDELSLSQIIKNSLSDLRKDLPPSCANVPAEKAYMLPTFTLLMVRENAGLMEYFALGDSPLVIEKTRVIKDDRLDPFSVQDKQKLATTTDPASRMEILRKTRMKLNCREGYWIGSMDAKGIDHALIGAVELQKDQRVALCSDGFSDYFESLNDLLNFEFTPENTAHVVSEIMGRGKGQDLKMIKKRDDLSLIVFRQEDCI